MMDKRQRTKYWNEKRRKEIKKGDLLKKCDKSGSFTEPFHVYEVADGVHHHDTVHLFDPRKIYGETATASIVDFVPFYPMIDDAPNWNKKNFPNHFPSDKYELY